MSHDDQLATVTAASSKAPPRPLPRARLRAVHPDGLQWSAEIGQAPITIGRTESEDVAQGLGHATVSRRHFVVEWDAAQRGHVGRDLGSHNGSRVDGQRTGPSAVPLADGSIVQLGDVLLVFERLPEQLEATLEDEARERIPGDSPCMQLLRQRLLRCAPDPSAVLLLGETGTGKEHLAREIHRLSGRSGPLVSINCSAFSPEIIDSQLFGHVKGAFTGAVTEQPGLFRAANGGTLFLDEVGDLPLALQPKLLRALQEGEVQPVGSAKLVPVDVRVVAATHANLVQRVEEETFRRDLYARLALWELHVPPLRARRGDLLGWLHRLHADWLTRRPQQPTTPLTLAPEAAECLLLHGWPSNLRGLDRLVHDLASTPGLARPIARSSLPSWLREPPPATPPSVPNEGSAPSPGGATPSAESPGRGKPPVPTREQFIAVFEQLDGNVRAMAKHFARDRRQIYRWIEAHGLTERRNKPDASS
ncbi:MAG: sigma 54-interacting transcriptional regulator [Myxococcota bacterium]